MIELPSSWSEQERLVWQNTTRGQRTDFNSIPGYGGRLDPTIQDTWVNARRISDSFLQLLLTEAVFSNQITYRGIEISGAWIKDDIDLEHCALPHPLKLLSCRLDGYLNLRFAHIASLLSLAESTISGTVDLSGTRCVGDVFLNGCKLKNVCLNSAKIAGEMSLRNSSVLKIQAEGLIVEGSLWMNEKSSFADVDLAGARMNGVDLSNAVVSGEINMNGLELRSDMRATNGKFHDVVLRGAHIGDQLDLTGTAVEGKLDMNGVRVDGILVMRGNAKFKMVDLTGARIGDQLTMPCATITEKLNLNNIRVNGSLLMRGVSCSSIDLRSAKIDEVLDLRGATITGEINRSTGAIDRSTGAIDMTRIYIGKNLILRADFKSSEIVKLSFVHIEGSLDLCGHNLPSIDLRGSKILGELQLASEEVSCPTWQPDALLNLLNAEVGGVTDTLNGWPSHLNLNGFKYSTLGELEGSKSGTMASRELAWLLNEWLARDTSQSPQPYEQLARFLTQMGYREKAMDILYAEKERERKSAHWGKWFWLTLVKGIVGYGYRPKYSAVWAIVLVLLGGAVLHWSGDGPAHGMPFGFAYSFDMLLPIIKLRETHYHIDLITWARYYFYFHKIMGYVLASCLIGAIATLTKGKLQSGD